MEHLQFGSPYDYVMDASKSLLDYGYEQQGRLVEEYFRYLFGVPAKEPNDTVPMSDYEKVVRGTISLPAPGSGFANKCE